MTIIEAIAERLTRHYTEPVSDAYAVVLEHLAKGYWLSEFVDDAARELDLAADPGPLLADELGNRILGIARTRASEPERIHRIAASAGARLVTFLTGPYFKVIERRMARLASPVSEISIGQDIEAIKDAAGPSPLASSGQRWLPLAVLEKRLEIVYGSDDHNSHEMIAYGYTTHLQRKPNEIVSDLGAIPLPELAQTLFIRYMNIVGADAGERLEPKFYSLLRLAGSREREPRLAKMWDPCHTVERWIERVRNDAGMEPGSRPSDSELVEKVAMQPAQRRIVWLLADLLGHDAARIVSDHGDRTLEQLTVLFTEIYAGANGISMQDARRRFEPALRLGNESSKKLRSYFDPSLTVSDWAHNVSKRIRKVETREGQEALRLLFEAFAECEPYQVLAFLFTQCLGWSAVRLAQEARSTTLVGTMPANHLPPGLKDLRRKLEDAFCATFEANEEEKRAVSAWFTPLGNRLLPIADKRLADCGTREELASPLVARISNWRAELMKAVPPCLTRGEVASLFAWRYNLLRSAEHAVWMEP